MTIPSACHLWTDKPLSASVLRTSLSLVKTYEDDSHLIRKLLRCNRCGQLYFHEFYEIVDWTGGDDAQYSSWIPVDNTESADRLNNLSPFGLLSYTAIRIDFPTDAKDPSAPYWHTGESPNTDDQSSTF